MYGARDSGSALCYALRINGSTILLDCGWNEDFKTQLVEPLPVEVREERLPFESDRRAQAERVAAGERLADRHEAPEPADRVEELLDREGVERRGACMWR